MISTGKFKLFLILTVIFLTFLLTGCIFGSDSSNDNTKYLGKIIISGSSRDKINEKENVDVECKKIQTKYVCQINGRIVNNTDSCPYGSSSSLNIKNQNCSEDKQLTIENFKKKFKLTKKSRCLSGRCIEVLIDNELGFFNNECTKDEDCYDIVCYKRTTTTTSTTTTSTTTTTIQDDCTIIGCPEGTKYVGSKKTGNYYRCSSECGAKITKKNRVCLMTEEEALYYGFVKCRPALF